MNKWSRKHNWRNWTGSSRTCCMICFHLGDAFGNPPDHGVIIVKGIGAMSIRQARDAFKSHVKTHHEPEWLTDRLEWGIKR